MVRARVTPASPQGTSKRVLLVEDHRDSAEAMAQLLELWGHDVCMAHDGATAIELAQSYDPDVVLLDIGLPGVDGYEVARAVRSSSTRRPLVVALTGYAYDVDKERSHQVGIDRHLTKPVDVEALESILGEPVPGDGT